MSLMEASLTPSQETMVALGPAEALAKAISMAASKANNRHNSRSRPLGTVNASPCPNAIRSSFAPQLCDQDMRQTRQGRLRPKPPRMH